MTHAPKKDLCELIIGLRRKVIDSAKQNSLLKDELTFSQFEALWFIGPGGKKSMEAIADFLKITPPSATSMIGKMEKIGFVSRIRDKKDKRVVYVSLTTKTKTHMQALRKHKEQLFKNIIAKLSTEDKKQLERIIRKLIED